MHSFPLSLALLTAAAAAVSGTVLEINGLRQPVPKAFIYEFVDGVDPSAFYHSLDPNAQVRAKFDSDLFRGASVQYSGHEEAHSAVSKMAQKPDIVKKVWPVRYYPLPKLNAVALDDGTEALDSVNVATEALRKGGRNNTFSPHVMMQVDKLRALHITGRGIKVGVIDTGVDYLNAALGGCFGKNCLVSFGYDLVGDAYNGTNTPVPDPDPMDCAGHGSHVSGIIAAQPNKYGFTGVAPGVKLGMYKVFGCTGNTGTDVLVKAALKAVEDGAQIISTSIGGSGGFSDDLWSTLLSRMARQKGIPCVVSAGNSGDKGAFFTSGMANGPDVMSIASFDNVETPSVLRLQTYSVDKQEPESFGYAVGDPNKWDNVNLPLWALTLDTTVADDGCSPYPDNTPDLSKYIVLIRRGTCTFVQKATNAAAKGAKYFMTYNNAPGAREIVVKDAKEIVAAGMVSPEIGQAWIKDLAAGRTVTLHMGDPNKAKQKLEVITNNKTGGAISDFSSWGPTMEMNFKPQFGAPGGNILSTLRRQDGSFGVASGTSMSTPMTAGVIALLGEYRHTLDISLIRNLLSANAKPQLYNLHGKFFDSLAPAAQEGSGLIQAYDAAVATAILDPPSLSFNDTEHLNKDLNFTITNSGKHAVTYQIGQKAAASFYVLEKYSIFPSPYPNEMVSASASLLLGAQQAVVKPGESKLIRVNAVPPTGIDERRLLLWSGYITVNGSDGSAMSLPYQGLAGSLRKSTTLGADQTWITNSTDASLRPLPGNTAFLLPRPGDATDADGLPLAAANLSLGSTTVVVSLTHSKPPPAGADVNLWELEGSPMTDVSRGQAGITFEGKLRNGTFAVPGSYKFVYKALRIAGNPLDFDDWDTSETPPFSIKYKE